MFPAEVNGTRHIFIGIFVVSLISSVMKTGETKAVYNELIPKDVNCTSAGGHGCICAWNSDCDYTKHLECIDGKCECELPTHRKFDESLGKCVTLVGSMCTTTWGWTPECVRNAECDGGRCTCRSGYSKTWEKTCKINFGEECGPNLCNSDKGLACKEGRCRCKDSSFVYSYIHANCLDPEAVIHNLFQRIRNRIIQGIININLRNLSRPLRLLFRIALGPLGFIIG